MCILSATVETVAATKLFTSVLQNGQRQFVVYSNTVDTTVENNTMILPVPNPDTVQFVNLSTYKHFFEDVQSSFKKKYDEHTHSSMLYASRSAAAPFDRPLPVYAVGSYSVSIVPSVSDFYRLNRSEFSIDRDLPLLLAQKYDDPTFGFLVCKLRKGNHSYHPFAYTHAIHKERLLFLPTYHIHPDGSKLTPEKYADWDHVIYAAETDLEQANLDISRSPEYYFSGWGVDWTKLPAELQWMKNAHAQRIAIKGYKQNKDLWLRNTKDFTVYASQLTPDPDSYRTAKFPIGSPQGLRNIQRFFGSR